MHERVSAQFHKPSLEPDITFRLYIYVFAVYNKVIREDVDAESTRNKEHTNTHKDVIFSLLNFYLQSSSFPQIKF